MDDGVTAKCQAPAVADDTDSFSQFRDFLTDIKRQQKKMLKKG